MKKMFPANKVLSSYQHDDDDIASSDNSRPNTQERVPPQNRVSIPISSRNNRPVLKRVESSLHTPQTSINRKRMAIKSDDNTEFESEKMIDTLEARRGIQRLDVTDDINFTKMQNGNAQAVAGLNACLINHFVGLSDNNDKDDEVDLEFIEQILSAGCDINCRDNNGITILHEIIRCWDLDIYHWFIEHGADIYAVDDFGVTTFHTAAGKDRVEILKNLIKRVEEDETRDAGEWLSRVTKETNENILHYAAKYDNVESIPLIHSKWPELIEGRDFMGRTPLMLAAELDRSESARELLSLNANPSVKDDDGYSCLAIMIEKMPAISCKAMDFFVNTHRSQRQQLFYLKHLEPTVDQIKAEIAANGGKSAKNEKEDVENTAAPLQVGIEYAMGVAVENEQLRVIQHPIMKKLIDVKWAQYGRFGAWKELIIAMLLVFLWTWVAVQNKVYPYIYCWKPYDETGKYYNGMDVFRLVMIISACCYNIFTVWREIKEFNKSRSLSTNRRKYKLNRLERNLKQEHPRWPDNAIYWEEQKKELEESGKSLQIYFSDGWNVLDWIVYLLLVILFVMHLIDWLVIGNPGHSNNLVTGNSTRSSSGDFCDVFGTCSLRERTCNRPHLTCEIIANKESDEIYTGDGRGRSFKQIYTDFISAPNSGTCLSDWYNRIFAIAIMFLWLRL